MRQILRGFGLGLVLVSPALPATAQITTTLICACEGNDPDASIAACTTILKSPAADKATIYNAYVWRSWADLSKKLYPQTIADATQAIAINPKNEQNYRRRGTAYDDMGAYAPALADATTAISLKPGDAKAYRLRAAAEVGLRSYDKAIACLLYTSRCV